MTPSYLAPRTIPLPAWRILLLCLATGIFFCGQITARADWQLIWSDEFNSNTLTSTNWTFDIGNGTGGWGNNEQEYYTSRPQNVYVTNGLLHIVAQQESYNGFNYTSAKLKSVGLFSCKYGRFEFYAKLPQGQGYWPALWMMPEDSVYGGWAASGEIDVMENKGNNPTNVLGTIHYGGMYPNNTHSSGPSFNFPSGDSVTNFHLYALEWTTNSISWYVDSQLYETQTNWWSSSNPTNTSIRNPYPAPFDQPFYIIMNLAVGGNFGGNADGTTVFPGEMQVDYVRVYSGFPNPPPTPPLPVLKLRVPLTDAPGTTTMSPDTNGAAMTVNMQSSSGVATDYHGAINSGVGGTNTASRAMDFSSIGTSQPGSPGPIALATNTSVGFGVVSNFTVSFWFKQHAMMANGANVGPRLFLLGNGVPADTGTNNSIGLKFQTATQLYLQIGGTTVSVTSASNFPTNQWLFFAATYDGANLTVYQGTETNSVSAVATSTVATTVDFGTNDSLFLGNRLDQQRAFNGWMQDFRFYTGVADTNYLEGIRTQPLTPPNPPAPAGAYSPSPGERQDLILDSSWRFIRQDVTGAQNTSFDDSSWTNLNLPHTWNNLDGQDGGNNYYRGIGWYRVHVTPDPSLTNREIFLKFDGAFSVADVWVNGNYLGEHQGGFAAFSYDATPYLVPGSDNVIAVKVNNSFNTSIPPLNADFTFFGGLYRDVHLLVTDPVQISPLDYGSPGIYLKTTAVSSGSANLQVTAMISNATASAQSALVRTIITDASTNIVTILTNLVSLPAQSISSVVTNTTIISPHLWNGLSDPYLYQAYTEVWRNTNLVDAEEQPLGFRSFYVDPTNGFFLNGTHYDLHGVNMHQDWLNCGWGLTNAQRDMNFALIKEIGATFLRLSHYEHNDYTYQLADQNGLCVWSEVPLIDYITESPAFYTNSLQQLREMIRQRYNHPSVVCWSVYNEITLSSGPVTTNLINLETQLEAQEDSTRPSTAAANTSDSDPSTLYTQLIAFNKYFGWYSSPLNGIGSWADNIHANYPNRCVGVSEYGAGASIYQHSENPTLPANTATSFHPEEWQNIVIETNWQMMAARPFLWCKLVWTSIDFASDGRNEGDTPGRNDKGMVTYDRLNRKDAFYFFKANWTTNPMVYITGHTFTNRFTNVITAKVYANCDSVQLFLNGISQGTTTSANRIYTWPLTLLPGTNLVNVIGTKGSSNVTDSLIWIAPIAPPVVSILSPVGGIAYLNSTNDALQLTATASNPIPANAMSMAWSPTSGPGNVTFANSNALATTASFSTNGIYSLNFTANNGAITTATVTVVVGISSAVTNGLLAWWKMNDGSGSTAADSSGNNRPATLSNAVFTNYSSGFPSNALHLNGTTSYATFSSPGVTQLTLVAWTRATGHGNSTYPRIVDTPGYRLFDRFDSQGSNGFDFATYSTGNGDWFSGANTINTNAWYHLAASYDLANFSSTPAEYINGNLVSTTSVITTPSGTQPASTGTGFLGNVAALNRAWSGDLSDVRIYNRILSGPEVQILANSQINLPAPSVFAGTNQTVIWPSPLSIAGSVTNNGNPPANIITTWSTVSGPGSVSFVNSNAIATTASFSTRGTYQLQLTAGNGQAATTSSLTVTVLTPAISVAPSLGYVQLAWPVSSSSNWLLQYQSNPPAIGLSTNWIYVPGPQSNPFAAPLYPGNGSIFYRLVLTNQ